MLSKEEFEAIFSHPNLVIRNLQITLGYYRLSRAMRKFMSSSNVNWLGFATYASKTAGQAIRHELLPKRMKSVLIRVAGFENTNLFLHKVLMEEPEQHDQSLTSAQTSLLAEVMKRVSQLVSKGNVMVFSELAWPFSRLVETFSHDWVLNQSKWQEFLQENFEQGPIEEEGQDYLIEAFTAFYKARFESNSKRKAEYVFKGNLLVGIHEQTRVQSLIDQALAVPFDVFIGGGILDTKDEGFWKKKFGFSRNLITRTFTKMWMQFSLPTRGLRIGRDVVAPTGAQSFPANLRTIEDPRCQALVQKFDFSIDTLSGSAADNWGSLKQRMNFVLNFFRSYQQYKLLFDQPFLDSQVDAIDAGHLPAGSL